MSSYLALRRGRVSLRLWCNVMLSALSESAAPFSVRDAPVNPRLMPACAARSDVNAIIRASYVCVLL